MMPMPSATTSPREHSWLCSLGVMDGISPSQLGQHKPYVSVNSCMYTEYGSFFQVSLVVTLHKLQFEKMAGFVCLEGAMC